MYIEPHLYILKINLVILVLIYKKKKKLPSEYKEFLYWRKKWQSTPVLLPGESHGQRSLVGCSPWGREESDTTERVHVQVHVPIYPTPSLSHY